jgi:hypothetical protein
LPDRGAARLGQAPAAGFVRAEVVALRQGWTSAADAAACRDQGDWLSRVNPLLGKMLDEEGRRVVPYGWVAPTTAGPTCQRVAEEW